jgi:hypothetical protein
MCRQNHGFLYEASIILKYKLIKCQNHTSKYDAHTLSNIPVQIKCRKNKSPIYLGDYSRNFNTYQDFILIIGTWEFDKKVIKEEIFYINHDTYKNMCKFGYIDDIKTKMSRISNNKEDDEKWRILIRECKRLYPEENLIKINMKRDHKNQKRIQCSIPNKNFNIFKKEFKAIKL